MTTHQLSTYVDLDWATSYDEVDQLLAEAEQWLAHVVHIDTGEPIVSLVTMDGPAGGNPVVRFTAQPDVIDLIVEAYDAEADG